MLKNLFKPKPEPKKQKRASKPKRKNDLQKQEDASRRADGTWKKGVSGNPAGRVPIPKAGRNLGEKFRNMLAEVVEETESGKYTVGDKVLDVIREYAEAGDFKFIEYMHARAYGKVPDQLILGEAEGELDLSLLTDEELEEYERLTKKALGKNN